MNAKKGNSEEVTHNYNEKIIYCTCLYFVTGMAILLMLEMISVAFWWNIVSFLLNFHNSHAGSNKKEAYVTAVL